jgi:hypothetical protein
MPLRVSGVWIFWPLVYTIRNYNSLLHPQCPQSITVSISCFLATYLKQRRSFSFRGHAFAGWLTHSAIFSASLAEPNSRLTAHLELRNSTNYSESESHATTDGQPSSLSWNKEPFWGIRPDFYYCQTVAGLLMWEALSDDRTGLSFAIAADPRQRSLSWVRVPWDSWPYFIFLDSRLPFSSTSRATVEVIDPASTWEWTSHWLFSSQSHIESVCLGVEPHLGPLARYYK